MKVIFDNTVYKIGDYVEVEGFIIPLTHDVIKRNPKKFILLDKFYKCISVNPNKGSSCHNFTQNKIYSAGFNFYGDITVISDIGIIVSGYSLLKRDEPVSEWTQFEEVTRQEYITWLLEECAKRFPPKSKVKSTDEKVFTVRSKNYYGSGSNFLNGIFAFRDGKVFVMVEGIYEERCVYNDGVFATLIEPIFKLGDTFIYADTEVFLVEGTKVSKIPFENIAKIAVITGETTKEFFLTYEDARKAADSFLTFDSYKEKVVKNIDNFLTDRTSCRLILEAISKDLDPDFVPSFNTSKYFIYKEITNEIRIREHASVKYDLVYFKSAESAKKAIKIMGSYIEYVV